MPTDGPHWAPPLLALQFLTRIPAPATARLTPDQVRVGLAHAVGWFPLIGMLVGLVTATVLLLADLLWPRAVAVLLALIVEARLTGAFHEDAVADFCDGFGGGHDAESTLRILRDSRIGSYGALGLALALALRATLMIALPASLLWIAIVAAATFGRLLVVAAMALIPPIPARAGLSRDIAAAVGPRRLLFAALLASPALLAVARHAPIGLLGALAAAGLFLLWFRRLVRARLGGSTGDCLGFVAYAGQLILLLAVTAG